MEIALAVPAFTLKEKRSVVRRVVQRTKNRFNVAVAETEDLDVPGSAVLGVVAVANDARLIDSVLQKVEAFIDALEVAEIVDVRREIEHR